MLNLEKMSGYYMLTGYLKTILQDDICEEVAHPMVIAHPKVRPTTALREILLLARKE